MANYGSIIVTYKIFTPQYKITCKLYVEYQQEIDRLELVFINYNDHNTIHRHHIS